MVLCGYDPVEPAQHIEAIGCGEQRRFGQALGSRRERALVARLSVLPGDPRGVCVDVCRLDDVASRERVLRGGFQITDRHAEVAEVV